MCVCVLFVSVVYVFLCQRKTERGESYLMVFFPRAVVLVCGLLLLLLLMG